jgi:hypothetical protein
VRATGRRRDARPCRVRWRRLGQRPYGRGELLGAQGDAAGAHGILLSKGRVTSFDAPGAAITFPFGLNNRGQIVGFAYTDPTAPAARGFLLARGVTGPFTPVDMPGAATTMSFGIDDLGRVVGGYQNPDVTPTPPPTGTSPMARGPDRRRSFDPPAPSVRTPGNLPPRA